MFRLPYEPALALRYLRPKRTFVSMITLISIIGVTLGVAVLIIVISVMSGFDRELRDKIMGFNAHLKVTRYNEPMRNWMGPMERIATNSDVRGVAPFVMGQVLVETQPEVGNPLVSAPWVKGIVPDMEGRVTVLPDSIVEGEYDVSGYGLLVGRQFADSMGLNVGDVLAIYSPRNLQKMKEVGDDGEREVVLPDDYVVKGIFDVGYFEYNSSVIITSLMNAQDLYDLDDAVHGLMIMINNPFKANTVRSELLEGLDGQFRLVTWMEENSGILNALAVEKNVMFYILFFIMIVAAFGITSALITFVVQKTKEIGMLKALGATRFQITFIFLSQSMIVGIIGVLVGFGLGMLALSYRNEFLGFMNRLTGFELFPAAIYHFSELPALIVPGDIAVICGASLFICILAGLFPAWNAGRLEPVEALRHE